MTYKQPIDLNFSVIHIEEGNLISCLGSIESAYNDYQQSENPFLFLKELRDFARKYPSETLPLFREVGLVSFLKKLLDSHPYFVLYTMSEISVHSPAFSEFLIQDGILDTLQYFLFPITETSFNALLLLYQLSLVDPSVAYIISFGFLYDILLSTEGNPFKKNRAASFLTSLLCQKPISKEDAEIAFSIFHCLLVIEQSVQCYPVVLKGLNSLLQTKSISSNMIIDNSLIEIFFEILLSKDEKSVELVFQIFHFLLDNGWLISQPEFVSIVSLSRFPETSCWVFRFLLRCFQDDIDTRTKFLKMNGFHYLLDAVKDHPYKSVVEAENVVVLFLKYHFNEVQEFIPPLIPKLMQREDIIFDVVGLLLNHQEFHETLRSEIANLSDYFLDKAINLEAMHF